MLSTNQVKKDYVKLSILCIILLFALVIFAYKPWVGSNRSSIKHDVSGYYLYLPSILIYHDVNAKFLAQKPEILHAGIFVFPKENNEGYTNIYPIGLAFAYLPFFLLAHAASLLFGFSADGYSTLYRVAMAFHPIIYLGLGLYYLSKSLRFYFNDTAIILTLFSLALGTNLFFYSTFSGNMPHVYLFVLLSIIIYHTIIWHKQPNLKTTIIIFACVGLSTIIRPTAIQFIIFPLLYNYKSLYNQLYLFYSNRKYILLGSIAFILSIIALPLYWKAVTGSFIYYSYQNAGFSFLHPHIFEVLIGFKKGLLIYTPILLFAFLSFKKFKQKAPSLFVASVVFLIIYIYVVVFYLKNIKNNYVQKPFSHVVKYDLLFKKL